MRRRRAKVDVGAGYPVQRLRLLQDRLRQRRIEGGDESGIIGNEERVVIVRRQQAVRIEERDEVRIEIRNEVRNENRNQGTSQNGVEELRLNPQMGKVRQFKQRADSMLEEVFRSLFEEIDTE